MKHYKFASNVKSFVGAKESDWEGLNCLEIPFAALNEDPHWQRIQRIEAQTI
jgi:hypothetical protein